MKICFICGEYPPGIHGGIGTVVQATARKLVQQGHEVKVIGVYADDNTYPMNNFNDQGVEVIRIRDKNESKFSFIATWRKQFKQVKQWADNGIIDIVEAPESRGWFAFWPKMKVPLVIRAHGSETNERIKRGIKHNRFTQFMEQRSYNRADAYSAVSNSAAEDARTTFHLEKPVQVIYNGIEFMQSPQIGKAKSSIVYTGTLNENKGVITLVKATVKLHEEGIPFTLDLYGKTTPYQGSDMISYLKSLIPEGMIEKVKFHGHVDRKELLLIYAGHSIAVFPSQWESFGLGPVEAMMAGCAVIYSDIPVGHEIIDNGINGLLATPNNEKELAEKIKLLLNDDALRTKLGEKAVLKVKNTFTLDAMTSNLLNFYQGALANF